MVEKSVDKKHFSKIYSSTKNTDIPLNTAFVETEKKFSYNVVDFFSIMCYNIVRDDLYVRNK